MARKAFYFDQEACVGCRGCQIVCKDKMEGADLQLGVFYRTVKNYESELNKLISDIKNN